MDIKTFIFESGITMARMARDTGYSAGHICGVIHGRVKPTKKFAETVATYTRGLVKEEEVRNGWEDPEDPLIQYFKKHNVA